MTGAPSEKLTGTKAPVNPVYTPQGQQLKANQISPYDVRVFSRKGVNATEVTGATCDVTSIYYKATVTTPGFVNIPSFAEQTPPVTVTCTYDGRRKSVDRAPQNVTMNDRTSTAQNYFGLAGALVASVVVGATLEEGESVFGYSPFWITFNQE